MTKRRRSSAKDSSNEKSEADAGRGSFADAVKSMGNVEPLDRTNVSDLPPLTGGDEDPKAAVPHPAAGKPTPTPEPGPDAIAGTRTTRAEMRRLRAGKIRPQQTIDLHGFTRDEAYRQLCNAITRAAATDVRCVLVIHGRGQHSADGRSVLRDALGDWIVRPPLANRVAGCCLAQPWDGGTGASYLLLRP